ncbi:hypothetical protein JYP52_21485 [Nitratireductor aquibiodomus]|uniref:hypothetical protein n=1 Tax=Nitratireductor aquibiodomus TaxID=204799 RepID=UPI0019D3896A|nr:hypothetical protein [Nitratireductor aquibiodomus]MBN7763715.1 hypothetical protein [Nitratireductor aquibiodomus]
MNHDELTDRWHKSQYDAVRYAHPEHDLPEWEDLPEEKKQKVREANNEQQKFMNDLGAAISTGSPLPDPFRGRS